MQQYLKSYLLPAPATRKNNCYILILFLCKEPTIVSLCYLQSSLKTGIPSRPIAPAPPAPPSTLSGPTKVPGQVTVTMESSIPQASAIPVATISGQQVLFFSCSTTMLIS